MLLVAGLYLSTRTQPSLALVGHVAVDGDFDTLNIYTTTKDVGHVVVDGDVDTLDINATTKGVS